MKSIFQWSRKSAIISSVLMILAGIVRFIAYYDGDYSPWFTASQIILPYITIAIFLISAYKRSLTLSSVAVDLGVMFFIFKSLGFDSLIHTILCICLYVLVLAVYNLTVFGIIKTKIPLVLCFALPLAEHIIQDIIEIALGANAAGYLPELSVLLIMGALLAVASGLKKS